MAEILDKPIVECRFAVLCKSNDQGDYSDMHFIKESITHPDGRVEPRVKMEENFERPFYITKKGRQDYQDKKEWTDLDNLEEFKSTESNLSVALAKALKTPWLQSRSVRDLQASPFVYGTDVLSTSLIKHRYNQSIKEASPYSNAVFDVESDVVYGTDEINMATISFKNRVYTAVQESFVRGYADPIGRIRELAEIYIGERIKERGITLEIEIVPNEISIVRGCMQKAHAWKPDFLSVWNITFDMNKILDACNRAGVDPADLMCDPVVPKKYRKFVFKEGKAKKTTASGKVMNFKPVQRWNYVLCPSSFYWIDAMCVYKQVRTGQPDEQSYALDEILKKEFEKDPRAIQKLKFKEAEAYTGLEWHQFMQKNYPLEYIVYNMFDCISMEMLDEKTTDLALAFPGQAGYTDFQNFNKQPKRAIDDMHFFCQENGKIMASTAPEMANELDEETLDNEDWITMLPPHLVADNGLCLIEENPWLRTNIRVHVGDLDVSAAYPTGEKVFNISKETTSKELIEVVGVDEYTQRMATINLSAGRVNAVEVGCALYGLPTLDALLMEFRKRKQVAEAFPPPIINEPPPKPKPIPLGEELEAAY